MSENRSTIKIRHGSGIPTTSNLTAHELGFSDTTQNLYIHNGTGITRIGINALTGSVDPVAADGQNGDFYIKTETTGNETKIVGVFSKVGGEWLEVQTGGGGGDASYEELTQAQYDALTPAEKNNGTIYFITDTNGNGDNFQPIIFSLEEREIGVWTDGKPLYERTLAANWSTSNVEIPLDFTPGTIFFKMAGSFKTDSQNNVGYLGYYVSESNNTRAYYKNSTNSVVCQSTGSSYVGSGYITIQYTKSTDAPGSGTWTPQGIPAVHYSTNEHIVGTWTDGSTIYEKTLVIPTSLSNGATQVVDASFIGDRIVGWTGYNIASNGTEYILPDGRFRLLLSNQALSIASINGGTWNGTSYITIRYTKSV